MQEQPQTGAARPAARCADRHDLYEKAVQNPPADVRFIRQTFRRLRGRDPLRLREDFCGTAAMCASWVRGRAAAHAAGLDLDESTLNWGIRRHLLPLGRAASRVTLIRQDVLEPVPFRSDVVVAFNFSYFTFKEKKTLLRYFTAARSALARDGILYLDHFGGPEAMELREERAEMESFTYVWDQAAFNPITHELTCHIHFDFPDGSRMRRAFTYHWRLWHIPELEELLREAGFRRTIVYWQGTERKTGEANGVYRPSRKGDNAPAYVCYLVALK